MEVVRIGGEDAGWDESQGLPAPESPASIADGPEFPLLLVTWRDAWFDFDQADTDDSRSDYLVTTVGFLVKNGPRFVSIAQELLPDGDGFRAVTHIPLSVVERMSPLQEPGGEIRDQAAT